MIIKTLLGCLLVCGATLNYAFADDVAKAKPLAKNVTAKEGGELVKAHKESKDFVVLDVRTAPEYAASRIAGSRNIDVLADDFEDKAKTLDKSKTYLVHCRSGKRSQTAFKSLKKLGLQKLYHLDGGLNAWKAAGLPVETEKLPAVDANAKPSSN